MQPADFVSRYPASGLPEIDAEHERIALSLQRLGTAVTLDSPDRVAPVLRGLLQDVTSHFRHEEQLMREIAYRDFRRHKRAHDAFLARAHRVRIRGRDQEILSAPFIYWVARLDEWFRSHVPQEDFPLAQAVLAGRARTIGGH